jgi:hypothetical protein
VAGGANRLAPWRGRSKADLQRPGDTVLRDVVGGTELGRAGLSPARRSRNDRRADILVRSKPRTFVAIDHIQTAATDGRCCGQECPRAGGGNSSPPATILGDTLPPRRFSGQRDSTVWWEHASYLNQNLPDAPTGAEPGARITPMADSKAAILLDTIGARTCIKACLRFRFGVPASADGARRPPEGGTPNLR